MTKRLGGSRRAGYKIVNTGAQNCVVFDGCNTDGDGWYADIIVSRPGNAKTEGIRVRKRKPAAKPMSNPHQISGRIYRMRVRQKKIRKFITMLLIVAAFFSGFFGHSLFNAFAKEDGRDTLKPYYTSIQLQPGDNLWKIANQYAPGSGYSVTEYVEELKRMNGLQDGLIHSGEYLTIVYFDE